MGWLSAAEIELVARRLYESMAGFAWDDAHKATQAFYRVFAEHQMAFEHAQALRSLVGGD